MPKLDQPWKRPAIGFFPRALQASVAPLAIARWVEVSRCSIVYMYKVDPLWRAKGEK